MPNPNLFLALAIAFSLNTLALYAIVRVLKKYAYTKDSHLVDRSIRKAYASRKKREIVIARVKRIRGKIFKLSFFQFFIPISMFMLSLFIYIFVSLMVFPYRNPLAIYLDKPCIAPIPFQVPEGVNRCSMQVSWLFFLVFLLYLPLYTYYAKKYLEI